MTKKNKNPATRQLAEDFAEVSKELDRVRRDNARLYTEASAAKEFHAAARVLAAGIREVLSFARMQGYTASSRRTQDALVRAALELARGLVAHYDTAPHYFDQPRHGHPSGRHDDVLFALGARLTEDPT